MKKSLLSMFCLVSGLSYSQMSNDSLVLSKLGYDLTVFGDETAEASRNWSQEEKEWFKSTFVYKRGNFRIPEAPIVDPFEEKD